MASPEQIKKFEQQIESSLDLRIEQLRVIDQQKSRALTNLKDRILSEIAQNRQDSAWTPEKEKKYSQDYRITEVELNSIFTKCKNIHGRLLIENGIEEFEHFAEFIGLKKREILFAHTLQEVRLFGKRVELIVPLGINNRIEKNYRTILEKIEDRNDLSSFIVEGTRLIANGGARLEFQIQRQKKTVKYSASPEGVFRVDKEITEEERRGASSLSYVNQIRLERKLFDEVQGKRVIELNHPLYRSRFSLTYEDESRLKINYEDNRKISTFERLDENRFRRIFIAGSTFIDILDGQDNLLKQTIINPDHTTTSVTTEFTTEGTRRCYEIDTFSTCIRVNEEGAITFLNDGKTIESYSSMKSSNPDLQEVDYVAMIIQATNTREKFLIFEENFLSDYSNSSLSQESIAEIRQHGKEITGIAQKEKALEERFNIEIETEKLRRIRTGSHLISISGLNILITNLEVEINKYPPIFIKNSGLTHMYLLRDLELYNIFGSPTHAGGLSFGTKIAFDSIGGFHHELLHCLDRYKYGLRDDNYDWGSIAHGKYYANLYGVSGIQAINEKKKHGQRPRGFVSAYAKNGGIDEDQAATAENLMLNNSKILRAMQYEPELRKKAEMIRKLYFQASEGRMDARFWQDLEKGKKIDAHYWENREA